MKKRYWRCFVCNDIHYGIAPPELCPTCKVLHAYVEISAAEARKILGLGADTAMTPKSSGRPSSGSPPRTSSGSTRTVSGSTCSSRGSSRTRANTG